MLDRLSDCPVRPAHDAAILHIKLTPEVLKQLEGSSKDISIDMAGKVRRGR